MRFKNFNHTFIINSRFVDFKKGKDLNLNKKKEVEREIKRNSDKTQKQTYKQKTE